MSTLSRITSGVKLMDLEEGVKIAKVAKVREKLADGDEESENGEEAVTDTEIPEEAEAPEESGIPGEDTEE